MGSDKQVMTIEQMVQQCMEDSSKWFGDQHTAKSVPHMTLGMAGEVGEFANIVKKIERGSLKMGDADTRFKMMMELTDVFVYWLNICGLIGMDPVKAYKHVRAENDKRFMVERSKREGSDG